MAKNRKKLHDMTRVLLLHGGIIPHYRIPIYNYIDKYLHGFGFQIILAADGIQKDNPYLLKVSYSQMKLSVKNILYLIVKQKIEVVVLFCSLRHLYLFPILLIVKGILRKKIVYWGHGRDLASLKNRIKNAAYNAELALCDAIILYAEHLKKYVPMSFQNKIFIANNTLCINYSGLKGKTRKQVLNEYGISTSKNIICVGRLQKRKRLENLLAAHASMNRQDIGLILVGPDIDSVLDKVQGGNLFKIGPLYGDKLFDILSAADVYCIPGAIGLSIVDGFHCGLPFVTENGDESAEIMYLKDGINGFIVRRGNINELAEKLLLLLDNEKLRNKFSQAAKKEIAENGNIEKLCEGFRKAFLYTMEL